MTRTILIVEDDEHIRELLCASLAGLDDCSILCAMDGEEAVRIARESKPEIILLDFGLPGMNGLDVCKTVKSEPATSHARVLVISGVMQDSHWRVFRQLGADAYVAKPFRVAALREQVRELLTSD